jgi:hypothetical protein
MHRELQGDITNSSCDCNGVFCQNVFDSSYTVLQSRGGSLQLNPDDTNKYALATGSINDAGSVTLVGNGVTCTGTGNPGNIILYCNIQGGAFCNLLFICERGDCLVSSALVLTTSWSVMFLGLIVAVIMALM